MVAMLRSSRVGVACLAVVVTALSGLALPVGATIDPLGSQLRISFMGTDGSTLHIGSDPSLTYNPGADEYLVVWVGDDNTPPFVNDEYEIYAQRLSGEGAALGARIRVSAQGADGNPDSLAAEPSVAYNPVANEYLVAWTGEVGTLNKFEIWGRRLSATGGRLGAADDLQISDMGPATDPDYTGQTPAIAVNSNSGEYLVVWRGDDNTAPLVNNEQEIFGQRLSAVGAPIGANDFRISDMGPDGESGYAAAAPDVSFDSRHSEFLVVWHGDDNIAPLGDNEIEVFGQRLTEAGAPTGANDFRISEQGADGNIESLVSEARVVYNVASDEFLVVWRGEIGMTDDFEIWAQRLSASGAEIGGSDFQVSDMGPDGDPDFHARRPDVTVTAGARGYLVVWRGVDDRPPLVAEEAEIFGQALDAQGGSVGANDFRISEMGPDGNAGFAANAPAVATPPDAREPLVVWYGDDDTPPLVNNELEIFGQRLGVPAPTLITTNPLGPANVNRPLVKGTVAPDATIDVFTNSSCSGQPAVNDAPAADLNGAGIAVAVPDNSTTALSAMASSAGLDSRCSNAITYVEQSPGGPGDPTGTPTPTGLPGFGSNTLVRLALASSQTRAKRVVRVRVVNLNGFEITGRLTGSLRRLQEGRVRPIALPAKRFEVDSQARTTIRVRLPRAAGRPSSAERRIALLLTARVTDPAGGTRLVRKRFVLRLNTPR